MKKVAQKPRRRGRVDEYGNRDALRNIYLRRRIFAIMALAGLIGVGAYWVLGGTREGSPRENRGSSVLIDIGDVPHNVPMPDGKRSPPAATNPSMATENAADPEMDWNADSTFPTPPEGRFISGSPALPLGPILDDEQAPTYQSDGDISADPVRATECFFDPSVRTGQEQKFNHRFLDDNCGLVRASD